MSRLESWLRRLEDKLERKGCPGCAGRPALIELAGPSDRNRRRNDPAPCPFCGERPEPITVVLSFDPNGCES